MSLKGQRISRVELEGSVEESGDEEQSAGLAGLAVFCVGQNGPLSSPLHPALPPCTSLQGDHA